MEKWTICLPMQRPFQVCSVAATSPAQARCAFASINWDVSANFCKVIRTCRKNCCKMFFNPYKLPCASFFYGRPAPAQNPLRELFPAPGSQNKTRSGVAARSQVFGGFQ